MAQPWQKGAAQFRPELRRRYDAGESCAALAEEYGIALASVRSLTGDSDRFRLRSQINGFERRYIAVVFAAARGETIARIAGREGVSASTVARYLNRGRGHLMLHCPDHFAAREAEYLNLTGGRFSLAGPVWSAVRQERT